MSIIKLQELLSKEFGTNRVLKSCQGEKVNCLIYEMLFICQKKPELDTYILSGSQRFTETKHYYFPSEK